ncbi:DUF1905 domain-containing protein [bacterium]|nr:DUF1905 domain-containing protein [bacterium]
MATSPSFEFPAPILKQSAGMKYHFMPVPAEIAEQLIEGETRRVIATINGIEENRAIHHSKDGEYFLILGLPVLRRIGVKLGDVVVANLISDPNPDEIEIPSELKEAFQMDEIAKKRYFSMTPGMQRSLTTYVTGVKRPESRIKRAMELAYKLSSNTLHGD